MQLLRKIAFPFSLLYGFVVYLRNLCYDQKILRSIKFQTPTICIGNLSVGGTGKTPMIDYLITLLQNEYKVAVLSRGYKRKTKGFLLAAKDSTVEELGDEPFQIYNKHRTISLAVDADRRSGIRNLEKIVKPELILLDDAFQHRKVKPHLSILLTTFSKPYYKDWYLPTGDLRDSKQQAKRADIIIVTKCPEINGEKQEEIIKQIKPKENQKVLFSKLTYSAFLISTTKKIPLTDLKKTHFSLVTGIANSKSLVDYLKSKNFNFEHFDFPDHYFFKEKDVRQFAKNELIITTEKDFTKLGEMVDNVFYLGVKHTFFNDGEVVLKNVFNTLMKDF